MRTTDVARIDVLQSELARRLRRDTPAVHRTATYGLRLLIEAAGQVSVRDVASAVGIGERRLQQLFNTHIGLSPSAWRRLARLHGCLRVLRRQANPEWSDVALEAGYYDQSHLINEFQALCGCTPMEFRREAISGSSKIAA
jgi:AraC-like DNA-binding protein